MCQEDIRRQRNTIVGEWDIVTIPGEKHRYTFKKVLVTESEIKYTEGSNGKGEIQQLLLNRDVSGKIYIDKIGTYILKLERGGIYQYLHMRSDLGGALL